MKTNIGLLTMLLYSCLSSTPVFNRNPNILYTTYPRLGVKVVGYDYNHNGIAEEIYKYQMVKDIYELREIHYDWNEDGKVDIIKQPHATKNKGYFIIKHER